MSDDALMVLRKLYIDSFQVFFKFQVLFVTYTTIQRLYNQQ